MEVVLAGASGLIGSALARSLRADGHRVKTLLRHAVSGSDVDSWDPTAGLLDPGFLAGADAVVCLSGVGVGDHRWNEAYKALIRSSRLNSTGALASAVAAAAAPPRVLLNASAVGYYGDTGDREVDESAPPGTGYFPTVCQAWEAATQPAEDAGIRVAHLRTGLVLGPGGGLLKPMLPLFRLGLGGRLGSGRQWMPWISLADVVGAIEHLLGADAVTGAVNLTGPAPVTNAEFTGTLGRVLRRPAVLPVPAFALRLVLGEFGTEAVRSQRVLPAVLAGSGYRFGHADLESALRWSVGR